MQNVRWEFKHSLVTVRVLLSFFDCTAIVDFNTGSSIIVNVMHLNKTAKHLT